MLLDLGNTPYCPPASLPVVSNDHVCLIGADDALRTDYAGLGDAPIPETTYHERSGNVQYQPVPYQDMVDAARSIFAEELGTAPVSESYALARGGDQMFGKMVFPYSDERGLALAFGSSYDRSKVVMLAGGLDTFVCANGQLSGEKMIRLKHTTNVLEKLPKMMRLMAGRANKTAQVLSTRMDNWATVPLSSDLFYSYVGILRGRGIITSTIANVALRYWDACQAGTLHGAQSDPNLANAFHAVTGGLQRVAPRHAFASFGGVDKVTEGVAQSGGSLEGIPAFVLNDVIEEY